MSTDPSFESLPSSILSTHQTNKSNLDQLAQREAQREPVIPQHYALSLADLRAQQASVISHSAQQPTQQPTPQQPTQQPTPQQPTQQPAPQQPTQQPAPQQPAPQQPAPQQTEDSLDIELGGDVLNVTTITELCEQASSVLARIAQKVQGVEGAQLEALSRKLSFVKVHPQGELAVIYAKKQRAQGRSWQSIAESLNEMMLEKSVYKPLRSSAWNGRSLKSLVHLRAQND